jgi:hypothetical protein
MRISFGTRSERMRAYEEAVSGDVGEGGAGEGELPQVADDHDGHHVHDALQHAAGDDRPREPHQPLRLRSDEALLPTRRRRDREQRLPHPHAARLVTSRHGWILLANKAPAGRLLPPLGQAPNPHWSISFVLFWALSRLTTELDKLPVIWAFRFAGLEIDVPSISKHCYSVTLCFVRGFGNA